jgi:Transposase DDE domain
VLCHLTTPNDIQDTEVFETLLSQVESEGINQVCADGIYDATHSYEYCHERNIEHLTPPREGAILSKNEALEKRSKAIGWIETKGRQDWKLKSGYSKRSLAETAMFRFKQTFSDKLKGRRMQSQAKEVLIKWTMLNRFAVMGMPQSKSV